MIVYIKQAEASFIVRDILNFGVYNDKRKEISQYQGSMTDSIQLDYYKQIANKTAIKKINGHLHCDDFISVTFDRGVKLKENEEDEEFSIKMTKKETRAYLYKNGFDHNGKHYVRYQRSSGSARLGNCLFINEKYYKKMIKFSNMGLSFKNNEECDDASLFAYQSLTLSTKIDNIIITSDEILLVNDVNTRFKSMASLTQINEKGKIYVEDKEVEHSQDIWDGQSLLDTSVFSYHGYEDKGMLLLRNHFFKSACFNTNIQKYYKDNNIEYVVDMFGKKINARKIKLITTPNSLKALKFSYKMGIKKQADEKMYEYWLNNIVDFGLVKYEKPSKFGSYNRTAYQMVNSLPFSRKDILELMGEEIDYINLMNNNVAAFKHRLSISELNTNYSFVMNMITINNDIQYTKLYKDAKRNVINSHKRKLLRGQIRIPNTDYFTMVSMPYEMLEYSAYEKWNPVLHGKQVYTTYYKDGQDLTGFRNPHINSGNVAVFKNTFDNRFETYFNFSNNIVIMNSWDNDVTSRLQGADWDSDTVLLTSNEIILDKAKNVQHHYTPVNGVNASKIKRFYNDTDFAEIDYIISTNKIGEIVNLSQLFNSHYWNTRSEEKRQIYYDCSSMLSSLSQIEIDKAKKLFDFSMTSAMNTIKKVSGVNVKVKPDFFRYIVENPSKCEFTQFETPMDYVVEHVKAIPESKRSKNIKISNFLNHKTEKSHRTQVSDIKEVAELINNEILKMYADKDADGKLSNNAIVQIYKLKDELTNFISSKKIAKETMCDLIRRSETDLSKVKNIILNSLYDSQRDRFLEILSESKGSRTKLSEDKDGDICIFGKRFYEKKY